MKKIMLILFALLVFTLPIQQNYMETNAAIVSKAASKTAQKIANEYIKDLAVNAAINKVADTTKHIKDPSRMQKEGFMMFCMDYTYKPGDKCSKPASVKANLSDADKNNISKQANVEMDKLISPNGKGFSKWAKFLDWFMPVWLISAGVGALTYALNDDVASLFDEAAYNTLLALGIIAPLERVTIPLEDVTLAPTPADAETNTPGTHYEDENMIMDVVTENANFISAGIWGTSPISTDNLVYEFSFPEPYSAADRIPIYISEYQVLEFGHPQGIKFMNNVFNDPEAVATVAINGTTVQSTKNHTHYNSAMTDTSSYVFTQMTTVQREEISRIMKQMTSIRTRTPYEINGFWYTDVLVFTPNGDSLKYQLRSNTHNFSETLTRSVSVMNYSSAKLRTAKVTVYKNQMGDRVIMPPVYVPGEPEFNLNEGSSYKDENGNIALLPPAAFTYVDESTGEQVERKPAPGGDGMIFEKPDGTQVPEENVIPKPDEEPKVTPAPDGTPQYTPAPTPSNPAPEPVPLQPNPSTPPAEPPPGTEPPIDPMPDGPSCAASLKMPIFSPLKEQLSTSFPFSIPWDIERAAHAAFDGVGSEKPSFDMVIPVLGENHEVQIATPSFMDKWKPFMDGFLLLTFDMLLMFGLYRFVKGAGS